MKKLLLLFLSASVFAQTDISFEASENYNLGNIHGQNGWVTTGDGSGGNIQNQIVTEELATNGTRSLKITKEAAFGPQNPIMGAFYNFPVPQDSPELEISFDVRITEQNSNSMDVNFLALSGPSTSLLTAARMVFNFQGLVRAVDLNASNELAFFNTTAPNWAINTWYNVRLVRNTETQNILYYVNDVLVYTGTTLNNVNPLTQIRFTHDNYDGSAFIDNFSVVVPSASLPSFESKNISMYPNPAKDILNVSSISSELISATITDLNGRVIKSFSTNNASNYTFNVSDLSSGMYILILSTNEGSAASKFIKN